MNITREQIDSLCRDMHTHDFLSRLLREIEQLQQIVFHTNERADWQLAHQSAEQILAAEIFSRHRGDIDGVYNALRQHERGGKPWEAALREMAGAIHSYFTTPLGIVMRHNLFGDEAVFLTPDALEWVHPRLKSKESTQQATT